MEHSTDKSECDLFPVHAPRDGTDDARGLAKICRPENGDANSPHVHVGVVTQGQAAADEAAATPPPLHDEQTERASTTYLATVIPSAPRMATSLPLTCDVSPPHAQVGVAPIAKKSFSTGGNAYL